MSDDKLRNEPPVVPLLLDQTSRLGLIEGQNQLILQELGRGIESRKEIHAGVNLVNERLARIETTVACLPKYEERIHKVETKITYVAGAWAALALFLGKIWHG